MLAISDISICNSALIKLGQEPITSLVQDNKSARLCANRYPLLRNMVLESHPWRFAIKTVQIAALNQSPLQRWQFVSALPADCIYVIRGDDWQERFEVMEGQLYCNHSPIIIKYVFENTDPSTYTYTFAECVAWRLAAELAYAITNSNTVADQMMKGYLAELANARYVSAKSSTPEDFSVRQFIDRRF